MMIDEEDEEFYDIESEPSEQINSEAWYGSPKSDTIISGDLNSLNSTPQTIKTIYAVKFLNNPIKGNSNLNISPSTELDSGRIFVNQDKAMKLCKQDPENRRFKAFKSFNEAYAFSYGINEIDSSLSMLEVKASFEASLNTPEKNLIKNLNQDAEKLPFSAPKKSEVNELRIFIEKNSIESFKKKANSNPRFLISAGDTPVTVQEAFRYNCLHICAKENRLEICQFILELLSSPLFITKLYKNDTIEQSKSRSNRLLDLYLNMPEKGFSETPLHFACKFGSLEVARLLMSFDACFKNPLNKSGKMPEEIICTKALSETAKKNYDAIKNLFEDCFYVPLYRDDDVGDVIVERPSSVLTQSIEYPKSPARLSSSPSINNHLYNHSQRKLAAYVGPVSPTIANVIYDRLKSPARLRQSPNNIDILRGDEFKGYERIVRKITDEMKLPLYEYWGFLDTYCNLKSNEGLIKLEIYLQQKKFQSILELQIKTAMNVKNELENNNLLNYNFNLNQSTLSRKINVYFELADELKNKLEFKENFLSHKFEYFVKNIRPEYIDEIQSNIEMIQTNDELEKEEKINIKSIIRIIYRYIECIFEISKIESTRFYFIIFKTCKNLFELVKCDKIYEHFQSSPTSKRSIGKRFVGSDSPMNNLSNKPKNRSISFNLKLNERYKNQNDPFRMRQTKQYDSDEEDDDINENDNDDNETPTEINQTTSTGLQNTKASDDFELLFLSKMSLKDSDKENRPIFSNSNNTSLNPSNNGTNSTKDEDDYILNNVSNKEFKNTKPKSSLNSTQYANRLFMFGDCPSKLDRAVYLAVQEVKFDLTNYRFLNDWFTYMKSCNKNEMNTWKSPMRKYQH